MSRLGAGDRRRIAETTGLYERLSARAAAGEANEAEISIARSLIHSALGGAGIESDRAVGWEPCPPEAHCPHCARSIV